MIITKAILIKSPNNPDVINLWPELPISFQNQRPSFTFPVTEGDGERYLKEEIGIDVFEEVNLMEVVQ